jgi:dTDP-4-dehydrorhamnose 3,5-epimerase
VRFDDPAFGIDWPGDVAVVNERDRSYPDFRGLQLSS